MIPATKRSRKSMDDAWRDITLCGGHRAHAGPAFRGLIFQDFLATSTPTSTTTATCSSNGGTDKQDKEQPPPTGTILSSNSATQSYLHRHLLELTATTAGPAMKPALDPCSSSVLQAYCKRRDPLVGEGRQDHQMNDDDDDDRSCRNHRNKRMMKNRESAARSRARRQEPP